MTADNRETLDATLELSVEDADTLCAVLTEHIRAAQAAGEQGEYRQRMLRVRDALLAALAAAGATGERVLLNLAPVEAVCLLFLVHDVMAQFPDCPTDEAFDVERALRLSHEMVTVERMQLL